MFHTVLSLVLSVMFLTQHTTVSLPVQESENSTKRVTIVEGVTRNVLTGYVFNKVLSTILRLDAPEDKTPVCTIDLVNNMASRSLVTPAIYLGSGKVQNPPPLHVRPEKKLSMFFTVSDAFFTSAFVDESSGVVAYTIKGNNVATQRIVYIFWLVRTKMSPFPDNMYFNIEVSDPPLSLSKQHLKGKYDTFKTSVESAQRDNYKAMGTGMMLKVDDPVQQPNIVVRAQMTNTIYSRMIVSFDDFLCNEIIVI